MNGKSFYACKVNDKLATYFTEQNFDIKNDGTKDITEELQRAVNDIVRKYGYGILYIPQGTYLLSHTVYIPKAVRVIGYGESRPEFILKDNAPGFDSPLMNDKGGYRYLFWFVNVIVENESLVDDANPGTFYSAMSNVNVRLGQGNEYAVAFRTHYAQHSFLAHIDIEVESGMAGIYDVGNEMEDIRIDGGQYGIITTKCSPGWPFVMIDTAFKNQKRAAIRTHEAGLTVIRTQVENTPKFIDVDEEYFEKIYIEDSVFENVSEVLLDVAMDMNSMTQINIRKVLCNGVGTIAAYKDSDRVVHGSEGTYLIKEYTHGIVATDVEEGKKSVEDILQAEEISDYDSVKSELLQSDLKPLPDMESWIDVTTLGIKGDGITDNTQMMNQAVEKYETLYFPQGEYLFTDQIKLKNNTAIISMHPYSTKLILRDNSEAYTGIGESKAFVESAGGGKNILYSIGIDTGGRNPRAIALKWKSGKDSYVNDVKLVGGHGNLVKGTGEFDMPYNESRTADAKIERIWDGQYPSFLVENGGGVFKDIWSASPYASSGFEVVNTDISSKVYCMSLEHHQRCELRFRNVANWMIYGIQTEEEAAEGEYALPMELHNCRDITFAVAYYFRTIFVKTAFEYCVKCYDCENVTFLNVHNYSQMKYTINNFLFNVTTGKEIRFWQAAKATVTGKSIDCIQDDIIQKDIVKTYKGFRFADGAMSDAKGNFYFVDSTDKRLYKIDGESYKLSLIFESPIKINSVGTDTQDNLLVVGEYVIPLGATLNGDPQVNVLPPDSYGTSYGFWYNASAQTFVFTIRQNDNKIVPLKKVKISEVQAELIYYPGNRWRDGTDFKGVVQYNPKEAYLAPDKKTIIPCHYDLIRSLWLSKAVAGEKFYSVDEMYKRVYQCDVTESGLLTNPEAIIEEGDYCVIRQGEKLYVCDDDIKIYTLEGKYEGKIQLPHRPSTIAFGGKDGKTLFVTAKDRVYIVV